MTNKASARVRIQKKIGENLGSSIRLASQLHPVDHAYKLLTSMRNRNIIMLAFCPLFSQISFESWIPDTGIPGCIEQCIT